MRERARVRIAVRTANGQAPPAGSEVALAAVDEGLLELAGNPSWNLLEAMMRRRSYDVETATAQMQVVGKRHFGLKALPQGGGGGRQPTRELFDTLLLWRARVPLDADGTATVEVPLNDSLTAFRIVAVATGGEALFGTGATTIRDDAGPDGAARHRPARARGRSDARRVHAAQRHRPPDGRGRHGRGDGPRRDRSSAAR